MSRRHRPSLIHRGYLHAQTRMPAEAHEAAENVSRRRMKIANAWKAGYLAAQNDGKRKT